MQPDENGWLPLHVAAANPNNDKKRMIIKALVGRYPLAVMMKDARRRLPIHLALEQGALWVDGVSMLVEIQPSALSIRDGTKGLLPFMVAAANKRCNYSESRSMLDLREQAEEEIRQRRRREGAYSETFVETCRIKEEVRRERSDQYGYLALGTIYELLLADPSVFGNGV